MRFEARRIILDTVSKDFFFFRANGCELCRRRHHPRCHGLGLSVPLPPVLAHDDRQHGDCPGQRPRVRPRQERAGGPHGPETEVGISYLKHVFVLSTTLKCCPTNIKQSVFPPKLPIFKIKFLHEIISLTGGMSLWWSPALVTSLRHPEVHGNNTSDTTALIKIFVTNCLMRKICHLKYQIFP